MSCVTATLAPYWPSGKTGNQVNGALEHCTCSIEWLCARPGYPLVSAMMIHVSDFGKFQFISLVLCHIAPPLLALTSHSGPGQQWLHTQFLHSTAILTRLGTNKEALRMQRPNANPATNMFKILHGAMRLNPSDGTRAAAR